MGSLGAGGSGVGVGSGDTEVEVGVPTKTSGCGNKEVAVGATGELVGIDDAVGGWGVLWKHILSFWPGTHNGEPLFGDPYGA